MLAKHRLQCSIKLGLAMDDEIFNIITAKPFGELFSAVTFLPQASTQILTIAKVYKDQLSVIRQ